MDMNEQSAEKRKQFIDKSNSLLYGTRFNLIEMFGCGMLMQAGAHFDDAFKIHGHPDLFIVSIITTVLVFIIPGFLAVSYGNKVKQNQQSEQLIDSKSED